MSSHLPLSDDSMSPWKMFRIHTNCAKLAIHNAPKATDEQLMAMVSRYVKRGQVWVMMEMQRLGILEQYELPPDEEEDGL